MRHTALILLFLLLCSFKVNAQEKNASEDPFDLTSINEKIQELGVPTKNNISSLRAKAEGLFTQKKYEQAIPALESYAKNANWLANIIEAGITPYYNASYDKRDEYPYSKVKPLANFESQANNLRRERNRAFVMQAECHKEIGDTQKAVALYIKALELISIDNEELWQRARNGLYDIVNVSG